ncbi:CBS domain-containing protein [Kitasatospora sp. CMC57]|uniref:CBS domain-containing protein n=1 Tax=Kitasatospora sp. CMC57 TaxID=3231513 RepID=A0AB33K1N9_9ACTN
MNHSILDGTPTGHHPEHAFGQAPVADWMSRSAVAVTPDTDFTTVLAAITASRRGVLPVVTVDNLPIGVIAASDLLAAYARSGGPAELTARALMTSPAVTVSEQLTVAAAVRTALTESVHHLPVVDADGRLSGLLSPHDLLDALRSNDEALRTEVLAEVLVPGSGVAPDSLHVRCERGHVVLSGRTRTRADAAAICLRVARIDGVAGVTDRLRRDGDAPAGEGAR